MLASKGLSKKTFITIIGCGINSLCGYFSVFPLKIGVKSVDRVYSGQFNPGELGRVTKGCRHCKSFMGVQFEGTCSE